MIAPENLKATGRSSINNYSPPPLLDDRAESQIRPYFFLRGENKSLREKKSFAILILLYATSNKGDDYVHSSIGDIHSGIILHHRLGPSRRRREASREDSRGGTCKSKKSKSRTKRNQRRGIAGFGTQRLTINKGSNQVLLNLPWLITF